MADIAKKVQRWAALLYKIVAQLFFFNLTQIFYLSKRMYIYTQIIDETTTKISIEASNLQKKDKST